MLQSMPESMRYALITGILSAIGCAIRLFGGVEAADDQLHIVQRAFDVAHSPLALIAATALFIATVEVFQSRRVRREAGSAENAVATTDVRLLAVLALLVIVLVNCHRVMRIFVS